VLATRIQHAYKKYKLRKLARLPTPSRVRRGSVAEVGRWYYFSPCISILVYLMYKSTSLEEIEALPCCTTGDCEQKAVHHGGATGAGEDGQEAAAQDPLALRQL
jgi:hypothetical protein